ncbi:MAG: RNA polymerase III subunit C82 [Vezdaea acicularis]|nr:MAG: RNA polymerase III subunit C82 [Vezdaea acicularis]
MSKHTIELCTILVEEIYGELSSLVFSVLSNQGRLTWPHLLHHTRLHKQQLSNGLAVLIQQHLVLHYTSPDDKITFYEAHWPSAYDLVRSGKLIHHIEKLFGEEAGGVVSNLLIQGHAKVDDIVKAYEALGRKGKATLYINGGEHSNGPHGVQRSSSSSLKLKSLLYRLYHAGYLTQVEQHYFRPDADNRNEAEQIIIQHYFPKGIKPKEKPEVEIRIKQQLQKWRDGGGITTFDRVEPQGVKREREHDDLLDSAARKRAKIWTDLAPSDRDLHVSDALPTLHGEGNASTGRALDPNLIIRVNHEKFIVEQRNAYLESVVESRIGRITSLVYSELLHLLSLKTPRCHDPLKLSGAEKAVVDAYDEEEDYSISTLEISRSLDPTLDLASAIGAVSAADIDTRPLSCPNRREKISDEQIAAVIGGDSPDDESSPDDDSVNENGDIKEVDKDSADELWDADFALKTEPPPRTTNTAPPNLPTNGDISPPETRPPPKATINRRTRLDQIRTHLLLLKESPLPFLTHVGTRGHGQWRIAFSPLLSHLRLSLLLTTINARHGDMALRLATYLSCPSSPGCPPPKAEEKTIQSSLLLKMRDVRATLTLLHRAGYLELQEVPRDATRQVSRNYYLWYFDQARAERVLLAEVEGSMRRTLQRLRGERARLSGLLGKAERSDVRRDEEGLLGEREKLELREWRGREERLLGLLGRLDGVVTLLRDF